MSTQTYPNLTTRLLGIFNPKLLVKETHHGEYLSSSTNVHPIRKEPKIIIEMAEKYGIDRGNFIKTIKDTAFKQSTKGKDSNDKRDEITNEQLLALLVIAKRYDLDPFANELYAYPHKSGIVPFVGLHGWKTIANRNPNYLGHEFIESDKIITMPESQPAPEKITCIVNVKGRKPCSFTTSLKEFWVAYYDKQGKIASGLWQTKTHFRLQQKALMNTLKVAFNISGIYDKDDAKEIINAPDRMNDNQVKIISARQSLALAKDINELKEVWKNLQPEQRAQLEFLKEQRKMEFEKTVPLHREVA